MLIDKNIKKVKPGNTEIKRIVSEGGGTVEKEYNSTKTKIVLVD